MAAIKPPMYTVAITPITVGSAAAFADSSTLHLPTLALFLLAAILIIAWLNISNDVFDFDTGIDVNKAESIVNLTGGTRVARNNLYVLANCFLLAAFACLVSISQYPWDPTILILISIAVFGGYAYQGPPFRLGYYGLGEPICFITWCLAVCAAYYSQIRCDIPTAATLQAMLPRERLRFILFRAFDKHYSLTSASILVAIPTTIILFCSHFHQLQDDERCGKKSPIVRLGTELAAKVLRVSLFSFFALEVLLYWLGMLQKYPMYLTLITFRNALELAQFVSRTHAVPSVVRAAKYYAVKFHFSHGLLLAMGFFGSAQDRVAS